MLTRASPRFQRKIGLVGTSFRHFELERSITILGRNALGWQWRAFEGRSLGNRGRERYSINASDRAVSLLSDGMQEIATLLIGFSREAMAARSSWLIEQDLDTRQGLAIQGDRALDGDRGRATASTRAGNAKAE